MAGKTYLKGSISLLITLTSIASSEGFSFISNNNNLKTFLPLTTLRANNQIKLSKSCTKFGIPSRPSRLQKSPLSCVLGANVEVVAFNVILSKILGYCIVAGSFFLQLPQLIKIMKSRSVIGLSSLSRYSEVPINSSTVIYHYLKNLPFSTYGEVPSIWDSDALIYTTPDLTKPCMTRTERHRSHSKPRVRRDAVGLQGPARQGQRDPPLRDALCGALRGGAVPPARPPAAPHLHQHPPGFRNDAAPGHDGPHWLRHSQSSFLTFKPCGASSAAPRLETRCRLLARSCHGHHVAMLRCCCSTPALPCCTEVHAAQLCSTPAHPQPSLPTPSRRPYTLSPSSR
jgi:hypothetical protein